jgi:ABC-2 type transport system ATP-binding protein
MDIKAVDNLSLEVMRKDIYGFLGPNGSGKSTTIRMMLSLLFPDSGTIEIFGSLLGQNRKNILRNVGAFIEKPDFYEYLSAYKNLEILCVYSGIGKNRKKIMEILELVGLKDRASSKVNTFSKGMKQRLGIAQTLLNDPELLILDEPASGLDPSGNRDIRELIRYLNKDKGKTIILSSHNLAEIEMIANRMLIIKEGRKIIEGEVRDFLTEQIYKTTFIVDNRRKALELINESNIAIGPVAEFDRGLHIQCTRKVIPEINAFLVMGGIKVESIKVEQNLEDFFLNLT